MNFMAAPLSGGDTNITPSPLSNIGIFLLTEIKIKKEFFNVQYDN